MDLRSSILQDALDSREVTERLKSCLKRDSAALSQIVCV